MRKLERLELFAAATEALLLADYRRTAGELGEPFFGGRIGKKLRTCTEVLGIAVPAALNLPSALRRDDHEPSPAARALAFGAAALTLFGGYVLRESILRAGKISADTPRHYLQHKELRGRKSQ
jgi:formate-dependent nitrite reductase membrane component NrfD